MLVDAIPTPTDPAVAAVRPKRSGKVWALVGIAAVLLIASLIASRYLIAGAPEFG